MIEKHGDVFDTDAFWIGHGVNCRGVMGSGIAKTVRERFPLTYEAYKKVCMAENLRPGEVYGIYEHQKVILNIASQNEPGPDARYDWAFDGLLAAAKRVQTSKWTNKPKKIAIPEIGCGIGGLQWPEMADLIRAVEVLAPGVEFEVWHYTPKDN